MTELERIVCPTCGMPIDNYEPMNKINQCAACGSVYVTKQARILSKEPMEKIERLKNLRKLIQENIIHDNVSEIKDIAYEIREIVPTDYKAEYYYFYSQARLGSSKGLLEFYKKCPPECSTAGDVVEILNHICEHSDLRDKDEIFDYINNCGRGDIEMYCEKYIKRHKERREKEEDYAVIDRDFFICHRSKNYQNARTVSHLLEKQGFTCWLSERNLRPNNNENYWNDIKMAIEKCKVFLVISSDEAMLSKDVNVEVEYAGKLGKPRLEYKIDASEHTLLFKQFFDGEKWINACAEIDEAEKELIIRATDKIKGVSRNRIEELGNSDVQENFKKLEMQIKNMSQSGNVANPVIDLEAKLEIANANADIEEYDLALRKFKEITEEIAPKDYRGWLGKVRSLTENYSIVEESHYRDYEKALKCAITEEDRKDIQDAYMQYAINLIDKADSLDNDGKEFIYSFIIDRLPIKANAYWGMVKLKTNDFKKMSYPPEEIKEYFDKALSCADENMHAQYVLTFNAYVDAMLVFAKEKSSEKTYEYVSKIAPYDVRAYWGMIEIQTNTFSALPQDVNKTYNAYAKVLEHVAEQDKGMYEQSYSAYIDRLYGMEPEDDVTEYIESINVLMPCDYRGFYILLKNETSDFTACENAEKVKEYYEKAYNNGTPEIKKEIKEHFDDFVTRLIDLYYKNFDIEGLKDLSIVVPDDFRVNYSALLAITKGFTKYEVDAEEVLTNYNLAIEKADARMQELIENQFNAYINSFLNEAEVSKNISMFELISEIVPNDYRPYLGIINVLTNYFSAGVCDSVLKLKVNLEKVYEVADEEIVEKVKSSYDAYIFNLAKTASNILTHDNPNFKYAEEISEFLMLASESSYQGYRYKAEAILRNTANFSLEKAKEFVRLENLALERANENEKLLMKSSFLEAFKEVVFQVLESCKSIIAQADFTEKLKNKILFISTIRPELYIGDWLYVVAQTSNFKNANASDYDERLTAAIKKAGDVEDKLKATIEKYNYLRQEYENDRLYQAKLLEDEKRKVQEKEAHKRNKIQQKRNFSKFLKILFLTIFILSPLIACGIVLALLLINPLTKINIIFSIIGICSYSLLCIFLFTNVVTEKRKVAEKDTKTSNNNKAKNSTAANVKNNDREKERVDTKESKQKNKNANGKLLGKAKKNLKHGAMCFYSFIIVCCVIFVGVFGCVSQNRIVREVYTVEDFASISDNLNGRYRLMNDIDFKFNPTPMLKEFKGVLDGNDKILKNVNISHDGVVADGIVSTNKGTIKNLYVENANIDAKENVAHAGVIAGMNYGKIENCTVLGEINANVTEAYVGGIAGTNINKNGKDNRGVITKCVNEASFTASCASAVTKNNAIGGIAGKNVSIISSCQSLGSINAEAFVAVGGIVGCMDGNGRVDALCEQSYNTAYIIAQSVEFGQNVEKVGGVCGELYFGTISQCYSTVTIAVANRTDADGVDTSLTDIGGIVGKAANSTISYCYTNISVDRTIAGIAEKVIDCEIEYSYSSVCQYLVRKSSNTFIKNSASYGIICNDISIEFNYINNCAENVRTSIDVEKQITNGVLRNYNANVWHFEKLSSGYPKLKVFAGLPYSRFRDIYSKELNAIAKAYNKDNKCLVKIFETKMELLKDNINLLGEQKHKAQFLLGKHYYENYLGNSHQNGEGKYYLIDCAKNGFYEAVVYCKQMGISY